MTVKWRRDGQSWIVMKKMHGKTPQNLLQRVVTNRNRKFLKRCLGLLTLNQKWVGARMAAEPAVVQEVVLAASLGVELALAPEADHVPGVSLEVGQEVALEADLGVIQRANLRVDPDQEVNLGAEQPVLPEASLTPVVGRAVVPVVVPEVVLVPGADHTASLKADLAASLEVDLAAS